MSTHTPDTGLATRLAALKGKLAEPASVVSLNADEGLGFELPPHAARPKGYAGPEHAMSPPDGSTKIMNSRQLAEGGQGPTRDSQRSEERRSQPARFGAKGPICARSAQPLLIGASKSQPIAMLEEAITLGLNDFGENKVQEAQGKWPELLARHPHVCLHLIGPLQSNKAADAVALFDVIHTIDRVKIADALAAACQKLGRHPAFLLQVNTGEEPQKAGVTPREVPDLLAHCRGLGLNIVGLMCVPPEGVNPAPHFALLKKMAEELGLRELSMGMSGDYETALRLGATMIRVGTALFGSRS